MRLIEFVSNRDGRGGLLYLGQRGRAHHLPLVVLGLMWPTQYGRFHAEITIYPHVSDRVRPHWKGSLGRGFGLTWLVSPDRLYLIAFRSLRSYR